MKRSTALVLCTFFDLFAVAIFYFIAYQPLRKIFLAIGAQSVSIEYNSTFFIGFCFIIIPTLHVIGFIETYLPRYFNRSVCTKVMWCCLIVSLIIGFAASRWAKQAILSSGYIHCKSADTHMKLSHFKVFVLDEETCRRLTEEKKSRNRAALR